METDGIDGFADALADADVECTLAEAADFGSALEDAVEPPAVGVPLDVEGISLADTDVETAVTPRLLGEAETGVTRVHGGVIEHGSFVIQSDAAGTEPVSLYPRKHVGVLRGSDLHDDLESVTSWLAGEFRAGRDSAVLATGPSATADMGKLVDGVHGPQDVHAVVLTDR